MTETKKRHERTTSATRVASTLGASQTLLFDPLTLI